MRVPERDGDSRTLARRVGRARIARQAKWIAVASAALLLGACTTPPAPVTSTRTDAAPDPALATVAGRVGAVATDAGLNGVVLVSHGSRVALASGVGRRRPDGGTFAVDDVWRWASVSKQITAVLVMQEVEAGRVSLDAPIARYLPEFASVNAPRLSVRHLLRHQSGLPNPDDTPAGLDGVPQAYAVGATGDPLDVCAGPVTGAPGGAWTYNNCDYIVAGRLLERVTGQSLATLVAARLRDRLGMPSVGLVDFGATVTGFDRDAAEVAVSLGRYGASGGIGGSIVDLWRFDRALLDGRLLTAESRAALWDGQPDLGFIALGQWVFMAPLAGCDGAVRIVERRGAIGAVQVRNFLLPERDVVVIVFTNRAETDFGEIWATRGLGHDLLAAAACS